MIQFLDSFFTRILAFLMSVIVFLTPSALQKVELRVTNDVTTQSDTLQIEIKNCLGTTILTGEAIVLEKRENGEWVTVEQNSRYPGFPEISAIIRPLQTYSQTVNVVNVYGDHLSEGEYRVTKEYGREGVPDVPTCSTTFSVKAAG